jgi:electron transfer flavoprotein beta subunit
MNIVVCVKLTPDPSDIQVRSDGSISLERAEWTIGNFDLQAIEAGVRLAEASGGKVTALSAGPRQINNSKLKKDVLSRGPDELYIVVDEGLQDAGTAETASVLAEAVRRIGDVDLVLCGEGSADLYFQQVGLQVGEKLCLPTLNAISKIESAGEGALLVERDLEDEVEVLEVPLPAVLSVTTDINQARLPSMKEILKAGKKPVTEWTLADLELQGDVNSQVSVINTRAPLQRERKQILISGTAAEAAQELADYLNKEGLV